MMDIEGNINKLLFRVVPHWYLQNALKEIELNAVGNINPASFNAKHWLNLEEICYSAAQSLNDQPEWYEIVDAFNSLITTSAEKRCYLNIFDLQGVWNVDHNEKYASLDDYALSPHCSHIDMYTDETFEFNKSQAFEDEVPIPAIFREWDGRLYLKNDASAEYIACVKLQNRDLKKHFRMELNLRTKTLSENALRVLSKQYYVFLMDKYAAAILTNLFNLTGYHVTYADFTLNQDKFAFAIFDRNNDELMMLMRPFIKKHINKSLIDFGAYLKKNTHVVSHKITPITQQDLELREKVKREKLEAEKAKLDAARAETLKKLEKQKDQDVLDKVRSKMVNPIETLAKLVKEDLEEAAREQAFLDKDKYGEAENEVEDADSDFVGMTAPTENKAAQANTKSAKEEAVEESYQDLFTPKIEEITNQVKAPTEEPVPVEANKES